MQKQFYDEQDFKTMEHAVANALEEMIEAALALREAANTAPIIEIKRKVFRSEGTLAFTIETNRYNLEMIGRIYYSYPFESESIEIERIDTLHFFNYTVAKITGYVDYLPFKVWKVIEKMKEVAVWCSEQKKKIEKERQRREKKFLVYLRKIESYIQATEEEK